MFISERERERERENKTVPYSVAINLLGADTYHQFKIVSLCLFRISSKFVPFVLGIIQYETVGASGGFPHVGQFEGTALMCLGLMKLLQFLRKKTKQTYNSIMFWNHTW